MAIVAFWMALDTIDATFTARTCVTLSVGSPSYATRYPAYFCFAHGTLQPVASPFLH